QARGGRPWARPVAGRRDGRAPYPAVRRSRARARHPLARGRQLAGLRARVPLAAEDLLQPAARGAGVLGLRRPDDARGGPDAAEAAALGARRRRGLTLPEVCCRGRSAPWWCRPAAVRLLPRGEVAGPGAFSDGVSRRACFEWTRSALYPPT